MMKLGFSYAETREMPEAEIMAYLDAYQGIVNGQPAEKTYVVRQGAKTKRSR